LNRVLSPRQGDVVLEGESILNMNRTRVARRLGYVPQRHPDTRLSVFEAVLMGRKPHMGWKTENGDYEVVERVIEKIGLAPLAMRSVSELSGGELQKVMIARALAQTPKVLLLDEPTSSLDLKNQLEVMGLIREIVREEGMSAIVAIHDLNIAVRFGDRFLMLKDHRVQAVAERDALSPEMIQNVYGVDVTIGKIDGRTVVVPV
jgi:iron complex transport system ATP-binding protein